jgi:hypothetical protein
VSGTARIRLEFDEWVQGLTGEELIDHKHLAANCRRFRSFLRKARLVYGDWHGLHSSYAEWLEAHEGDTGREAEWLVCYFITQRQREAEGN